MPSSMPSAIQFHDQLARNWSGKYTKRSFTARASALLSFPNMKDLHGQKWLDIGCGSGWLSSLLSERGGSVVGVDASYEMIRIASQITSDSHSGSSGSVCALLGKAENLPLRANAFDGVLCSSVIEYLSEAESCLSEINRILKPSGSLIVSVPIRFSAIRALLKVCALVTSKCFRSTWPSYLEYSRLEFSRSEFINIVKAHNFYPLGFMYFSPILPKIVSCRPFASLMIFSLKKQNTVPEQNH